MEKAISYFKEAVELTSDDHPDRPRRLNSLGNSYIKRFELIGDLEDLKEASSCFDLAVTLIPDGHPDKAKCLNDSGRGHRRLFLNVGLVNDAMAALESFERAALMSSGHPYERLKASMNWARSSKALGLSPLNAYTRALELMHRVAWLGIPVDHRYERLATDLQHLATEATAGAIAMQCYELALEWLEQGRCVVWRQLLELRTPLDRLMNSHPEMAKELKRVSHLLEGASMSDSSDHPSSQGTASLLEVAQRHRRLAEERERLVASIRPLPNFDDFLLPPKFASLLSGLHDGVVVVINVHSEHCDALVVRAHTHNTTHVPLKGFSYQKAEKARKDLEGYLRGLGLGRGFYTSKRGTKQIIKEILSMLWYDVVQPILGHLGINVSFISQYIRPLLLTIIHLFSACFLSTTFLTSHGVSLVRSPSCPFMPLATTRVSTPCYQTSQYHRTPPTSALSIALSRPSLLSLVSWQSATSQQCAG
ncbi:hypothetical protein FS749_015047 [Ceratobasidium sp. UAMH 11750]|nr:hypothetical protein FS749_015047 [Ceratobasidium sp. UAMH 11750]